MSQRTRQLCTFQVGNLYLGIDVQKVQEVIRYLEITRVPLASPAVRGLINLRGQIVTAIDLRKRLSMQLRQPEDVAMNVVVRDGDSAVSLLVDRIGDVLELDDQQFEPPPATISSQASSLILGAYKLPDRLLLVLDTKQAVTVQDSACERCIAS